MCMGKHASLGICVWQTHTPLWETHIAIHVIVDLRFLKGAKLSSKSLKQRGYGERLANSYIEESFYAIQNIRAYS